MGRGKSPLSLGLIEACHEILAAIQPASVRAVCYQLFTRGLINSMSKNNTNRISRQLTDAREAGDIPWEWIVDETREAERISSWANPAGFVESVRRAYRKDHWELQPTRIEVWSEKGTVRGTVAPVLNEYGVTFRVMHGHASATVVNQIVEESFGEDRPLIAFYVGDWDPSGMHMSEIDLPERIERYWRAAAPDEDFMIIPGDEDADPIDRITVERIALAAEDVADPALPWFPVESKLADSRATWFRDHYGPRCWELDALNPNVLRDRVRGAIAARLDWAAWDRSVTAESAEAASLRTVLDRWNGADTGA
jgi:hypothetical protein